MKSPKHQTLLSDQIYVALAPLESLFEVLQEANDHQPNNAVVSTAIVSSDLLKHAQDKISALLEKTTTINNRLVVSS